MWLWLTAHAPASSCLETEAVIRPDVLQGSEGRLTGPAKLPWENDDLSWKVSRHLKVGLPPHHMHICLPQHSFSRAPTFFHTRPGAPGGLLLLQGLASVML